MQQMDGSLALIDRRWSGLRWDVAAPGEQSCHRPKAVVIPGPHCIECFVTEVKEMVGEAAVDQPPIGHRGQHEYGQNCQSVGVEDWSESFDGRDAQDPTKMALATLGTSLATPLVAVGA